MGFDVGSTLVMDFTGTPEWEGAEVKLSLDVTMERFFALQRAFAGTAVTSEREEGAPLTDEDEQHMQAAMRGLGDTVLSSWNLEREGEPIPATGDGMLMIPMALANLISTQWMERVSGQLPEASGASSSDGSEPEAPPTPISRSS